MKKITTLTLLFCIALNVFAQQEIPMFFDNDLMLQTDYSRQRAYSPDGSKIATVFGKGKIAIWDAATGKIITKLAGHGNIAIDGIVFSPNGRQLASCAEDDTTIKIWDATSGTLIRSISQAGVRRISFNHDGSRIVGYYLILTFGVGTEYGIKIWNVANGSVIMPITDILKPTQSITYSPDGKRILASSNEGIRIWDAANGQTIRTINGETRFTNVVYSPNGQYIAAYVNNPRNRLFAIQIYNAETGQEIRSIPVRLNYDGLMYSSDGRQLLVNAWDSDNNIYFIKIFNTETGQELRSFNINSSDHPFAFSSDGRRIFTFSRLVLKIDDKDYGASYATLLDATTGKVTGTIGYGPLNVGARAYADLQIARFLNDTAAVNRHEAVLQFITGRGNATRAEIEKFYRDNVRSLIAAVVDEEFKGTYYGKEISAHQNTIDYIKQSLVDFCLTPNQTNFTVLRNIRININSIKLLQQAYSMSVGLLNMARERGWDTTQYVNSLREAEAAVTPVLRALRAPVVTDTSWDNADEAYNNILRKIFPYPLFQRIWQ